MALIINKQGGSMRMHTLDKDVHTTIDGSKLAGEKDQVKILLGRKGHKIPEDKAIELGILDPEEAVEKFAAEKRGGKKVEDKAGKPAEEKGGKKSEDKAK